MLFGIFVYHKKIMKKITLLLLLAFLTLQINAQEKDPNNQNHFVHWNGNFHVFRAMDFGKGMDYAAT